MLNYSLEEFRTLHNKKKNLLFYHSKKTNGNNEISNLINNLQTIVSRNTNPLESTVVTVGMINGGYNFNVIADKVILKGTTRSYTEKNRKMIKKRMADIILGIEKMYGAKIAPPKGVAS